jgi:hypothetical protein
MHNELECSRSRLLTDPSPEIGKPSDCSGKFSISLRVHSDFQHSILPAQAQTNRSDPTSDSRYTSACSFTDTSQEEAYCEIRFRCSQTSRSDSAANSRVTSPCTFTDPGQEEAYCEIRFRCSQNSRSDSAANSRVTSPCTFTDPGQEEAC